MGVSPHGIPVPVPGTRVRSGQSQVVTTFRIAVPIVPMLIRVSINDSSRGSKADCQQVLPTLDRHSESSGFMKNDCPIFRTCYFSAAGSEHDVSGLGTASGSSAAFRGTKLVAGKLSRSDLQTFCTRSARIP